MAYPVFDHLLATYSTVVSTCGTTELGEVGVDRAADAPNDALEKKAETGQSASNSDSRGGGGDLLVWAPPGEKKSRPSHKSGRTALR